MSLIPWRTRLTWAVVVGGVLATSHSVPAQVRPGAKEPPLPGTLHVVPAAVGKKATTVALQNVKYAGAAAIGRPATGTADLALTLIGHPLPVLKNQPFSATVQDRQGKVSAAKLTLDQDLTATRFLGESIDLVLEKGSQIVPETGGRPGAAGYTYKGSVRLVLPYRTAAGKPYEIHLGKNPRGKPVEISLSAATFTLAEKDLTFPATTITVGTYTLKNVQGFRSVKLHVDPDKSKPMSLEVSNGPTQLVSFLPGLLLKDGIPLSAPDLELVDGALTFNGQLAAPKAHLDFIRPLGYTMDATKATVKVVKGEVASAALRGTITFPSEFATYVKPTPPADPNAKKEQPNKQTNEVPPKSPGDLPATIEDARLTYGVVKGKPTWSTAGSGPFSITWGKGGGGLKVDSADKYALALDGPGAIRVFAGTFLSTTLKYANNSPVEVDLRPGDEFYLNGQGATGGITVDPKLLGTLTYPGTTYGMTITSPAARWQFSRGNLTKPVVLNGKIVFPLDPTADLSAVVTIHPNLSYSAAVGGRLSIPAYGMVVRVDHADFNRNEIHGSDPILTIAGTVTIDTPKAPQLKTIAIPVTNLLFNKNGLFGDSSVNNPAETTLSLGHEVSTDLGSFTLRMQTITLPHHNDLFLAIGGQAILAEDFPPQPYMPGIKIGPGQEPEAGADGAEVLADEPNFGKIHIQEELPGDIGSIDFELSHMKDMPFGTGKVDCWYSSGHLKLFGGGAGGGMTMFVAGKAWGLFGTLELATSIPLGNSGLALYAFRGGIGRNVDFKAKTVLPGPDDLAMDKFGPAPGNWLFQAGVGITTKDEFLVWGNGLLTVSINPLSIKGGAVFNVFESKSDNPSGDRVVTGSFTINGSEVSAQLTSDLNFPSRSLRLVSVSGGADALFSADECHVYVGWPLPDKAAGVSLIGGALNLRGGMGTDLKTTGDTSTLTFGAGFLWRSSFLGIVEGELDGNLSMSFVKKNSAKVTDISATLSGGVHVFGEVDFYVFSASAEAWLNGTLAINPTRLHVDGRIEGCIDTFLGDGCASVGFSGTW